MLIMASGPDKSNKFSMLVGGDVSVSPGFDLKIFGMIDCAI